MKYNDDGSLKSYILSRLLSYLRKFKMLKELVAISTIIMRHSWKELGSPELS